MSTTKSAQTAPNSPLNRETKQSNSHWVQWAKQSAIQNIEKSKEPALLCRGIQGSAIAALASALYKGSTWGELPLPSQPLLIVAFDEEAAGYLYGDLVQLIGKEEVFFYPSSFRRHIKYGHVDAGYEVLRAELITALSNGSMPLVVTYPMALAEAIPNKEELEERILHYAVGEKCHLSQLREWLLEEGFTLTDYVYEPGEVAFRGSIVDIYSYNSDFPYRLDFFDDEIESIRTFDPSTQLSKKKVEEVSIVSKLSSIDSEHKNSLFSLLPATYRIVFADYDHTIDTLEQLDKTEAIVIEGGEGFDATSDMKAHLLSCDQLVQEMGSLSSLHLHSSHRLSSLPEVPFQTTAQPLFHKNFDLLIEGLQRYRDEGYTVYFLSEGVNQSERLQEILSDLGREDLFPLQLPITLHEGFEDHTTHQVFLTDHQLFERYHKYQLKSDKVRLGKVSLTIKDLNSFNPGDYIVHYDHGIGQFAGLITMMREGKEEEVLKIVYRNNDYILVSLHNLRKLSKYRAKDDGKPQLSQLGSGAWLRIKEKTKKKIKDIARELIVLYAARKEAEGFAFSPDSYLQKELEASFIYEETPDQLKAVEAVKHDMEQARPMDRLLCGDVGFGKTEVAIRAAFKAVCDSKQVAVLVPTTLLAYQHYCTFSERLKDFPVRIAYFSRARSAKETKKLLEELAEGKIDIIIGTHRIVGKNVQFKDLGLLIVDEEQKFGVKVKEALRQLQVNVDTLSMSATPIPRTLQFSLMGTRDLSNILTPPPNRYPIQTEIIDFNAEIIAEAINFELSRKGQVYYVHNRIEDIEDIAAMIRRNVPKCRVAVGHGRMQPSDLEEIILDFARQEYDVLVATTIIENGIDIPNANTIIIDRAHHYGLSSLHQLRGRVGRSSRKAFCYLIAPPLSLLNDTSQRRLRAIEGYSDLGSGLRIAMQDLDIRGAGNIFGSEQSGFIADMGIDAYHKVFDEAVREVKREEFSNLFAEEKEALEEPLDTVFESDLALSFPPEYIPQDAERITLYRELDSLTSEEDIENFCLRLKDRFGAIPKEGEELIRVPSLRSWGRKLGLIKITLRKEGMNLFLPEDPASAYYQSDLFSRLLVYITRNTKTCLIEQGKKGQRVARIQKVPTVSRGVEVLKEILSTPTEY